ncbi:hypothetical protein IWQ56_000255 [Coemansia nantahalensis]|uniref:Uncharacterized protein n=1 Tax=Coemansia helicoidea TaxID=1286919 RepID=A0ACC1LF89_9FUNG|nr:hypothetical protein IWQ56_000255 [Coemansia nantahalensis]KAJ2806842.1 hypothetical protein H4R21_000710 [Coemansia helicoidea]
MPSSNPGSPEPRAVPPAPTPPAVVATRCAWGSCATQLASMHLLSGHISASHILALDAETGFACAWRGCPQNGEPLPSYPALVDHLRAHTGNRSYLCPVPACGKVYKRSDFLTKHISAHADPPTANGHPQRRRRRPPGSPVESTAGSDSDSAPAAPDTDAHVAMLMAQLAYIRSQVAERTRQLERHRVKARRLRLENDILIDALAQQ